MCSAASVLSENQGVEIVAKSNRRNFNLEYSLGL